MRQIPSCEKGYFQSHCHSHASEEILQVFTLLACFWIRIVQEMATCLCFCPVLSTILLELMTGWWDVFSPRLLSLINPGTWPDNIPWIIWTLLNRTPLFFCSCFEPRPCCHGLFLGFWYICRHKPAALGRFHSLLCADMRLWWVTRVPLSSFSFIQLVFLPVAVELHWKWIPTYSVILQRSALFFFCK